MQLHTARFGTIDLPADAIYTFPGGIPGFPDENAFALLKNSLDDTPFRWLQSCQDSELSFLAVDPRAVVSGYTVVLNDDEVALLQAEFPQQLQLLCLVTVPEGGLQQATVNLKAPVVLNPSAQLAAQIIIEQPAYLLRQPLFAEEGK